MLSDTLVDCVADVLRSTHCVIMPGGHGGPRLAARRRCKAYLAAPDSADFGPVGRCYVCLAILGAWRLDGESPRDKWSGRNWIIPATAWFDQQEPLETLDSIPHNERWVYLLRAMLRVVEWWCIDSPGPRQQAKDRAIKWAVAAEAGLREIVKGWDGARGWPVFDADLDTGSQVAAEGEALWADADIVLSGADRILAQLMVCLHVLHADIGVQQTSLLSHVDFAGRAAFYNKVLRLMRHGGGEDCPYRLAHALAGALETTPLLAGAGAPATAKLYALLAKLPAVFRDYCGQPLVTLSIILGRLPKESPSREALSDAWQLGQILADVIIDPLRVRKLEHASPGLMIENYAYLDGRVRTFMRKPGRPAASNAHLQACARYSTQMISGRMTLIAQQHLQEICGNDEWSSEKCALCFIDR